VVKRLNTLLAIAAGILVTATIVVGMLSWLEPSLIKYEEYLDPDNKLVKKVETTTDLEELRNFSLDLVERNRTDLEDSIYLLDIFREYSIALVVASLFMIYFIYKIRLEVVKNRDGNDAL